MKSLSQETKVFISYARGDGEAFALMLRKRLQEAGISLWRDRENMEGGRDWWLQISDALDHVEYMVLVMTPAAMQSAVVRKEWRYARQKGVCVYPVIAAPNLDFEALPRWMRNANFYDIEHSWQKFVNDLNTRCTQPRVPFMPESQPEDFIPRPVELRQLVSYLFDRSLDESIAGIVALKGAGGYGKTALARAVCHDDDVQNVFDDGVLWVTLGESPGDLTAKVEDLIYTLSGERPGFSGVDAAAARFAELLADRDILIVIDDVWNGAHLKPFLQGGLRCARLITTRNAETLPAETRIVDVDAMRQEEAAALLGFGLPEGQEKPLRELASRLGEWPLLLKLANGALRERVLRLKQSLPDALAFVSKALTKRGVTFFDARDAAARHQAVSRTLDVSIGQLNATERDRYTELAIFPEDANIPLSTLEKLWGATGSLDDFATEELCDRLKRLSLIVEFDPTRRFIRLHDVIRQYLLGAAGEQLRFVHAMLLDAHRPFEDDRAGWFRLPKDEPYLWDYLAYHLAAAGLQTELAATVKDLRYLTAKAFLRKALQAEKDLRLAERYFPDDGTLQLLRRSFVAASHILNRCETLKDLQSTLLSRLEHLDLLFEMTGELDNAIQRPCVVTWHALPDLPHPALIRTWTGHRAGVNCCAVSRDGSLIVSGCVNGVVKICDANTGVERLTIPAHQSAVTGCAISPDGTFIVSTSARGGIKIWDCASGEMRGTLYGHKGMVTGCAVSPDNATIVSCSNDRLLKVWDAKLGVLRFELVGHETAVVACAISGDGSTIVSASEGETLRFWNAQTGEERETILRANAELTCCAISADGTMVVAGSQRGTLHIWDLKHDGRCLKIQAHLGAIASCALSLDGALILSAASDRMLKLWDANTGEEHLALNGHYRSVLSCAICENGGLFVSSSEDGSVRLWDAAGLRRRGLVTGWEKIRSYRLSPDGGYVLSIDEDDTLKIWDTGTGMPRFALADVPSDCGPDALSRDGRWLVCQRQEESAPKVWDARTGAEGIALRGEAGVVRHFRISPDGSFIVGTFRSGWLSVWDIETGNERFSVACRAMGREPRFELSPDGAFIVVQRKNIREGEARWLDVISTSDGRVRYSLRADWNNAWPFFTLSPDGRQIVSEANGKIIVWDVATAERCYEIDAPLGPEDRFEFSADGASVVLVASQLEHKVQVFDASTGQQRIAIGGETKLPHVMLSPDSSFLIADIAQGIPAVINLRTGDIRFAFDGTADRPRNDRSSERNSARNWWNDWTITPDGSAIVESGENLFRVWNVTDGRLRFSRKTKGAVSRGWAISPDSSTLAEIVDTGLRVRNMHSGDSLGTLHTDGDLYRFSWLPDSRHLVATGAGGLCFFELQQMANDAGNATCDTSLHFSTQSDARSIQWSSS